MVLDSLFRDPAKPSRPITKDVLIDVEGGFGFCKPDVELELVTNRLRRVLTVLRCSSK